MLHGVPIKGSAAASALPNGDRFDILTPGVRMRTRHQRVHVLRTLTGCSVTWLARLHGVQKVAGSNPVTPTVFVAKRTVLSGAIVYSLGHPTINPWVRMAYCSICGL